MCLVPSSEKDRDLIEQVQRWATRLVPETKGITIQQQTKRITASYLELPKTENRHNPDFQNYQKNRLGQPGLQMFTVPVKADVQKS